MKIKLRKLRPIIIIIFTIMMLTVILTDIDAKTLTNEDIRYLKRQQNRDVPTHRSRTSAVPSVPGVPTVPTVPGVSLPPTVPGIPTVPPATTVSGIPLVKKPLPYNEWEEEYKEYFKSYYNDQELSFTPKMIALHYSGTDSFAQLWWTFVNGGVYEGKKGHLSVHYAIDKDGTIYELVPPTKRARGTYGVNHVAISIDIIAKNETEILNNKKQLNVSFSLVKWLMKQYKIPKEKVLGHYEIAKGKELIPEYTDFVDKKYPDRYPPNSKIRGPGKAYMFKLRYYLVESK